MDNRSERNSLYITRKLIDEYVVEGARVLDATVGNGNDSLLLARKLGERGQLYGFDIQDLAIKNTKDLLSKENLMENTRLIKDSHENIDKYIHEPLDFAIYNLGYLPKGDKEIKTKALSSIISLEKTLKLLKQNGILVITSYTGHPGGMEEKKAIEDLLVNLDQRRFNVLKYEFINQKSYPPLVYRIEKIKI